jgi:hypothetical protein
VRAIVMSNIELARDNFALKIDPNDHTIRADLTGSLLKRELGDSSLDFARNGSGLENNTQIFQNAFDNAFFELQASSSARTITDSKVTAMLISSMPKENCQRDSHMLRRSNSNFVALNCEARSWK